MHRIALALTGLTIAGLVAGTAPVSAQEWPTKTVRIMVPFGPGSTPDIVARLLAERLQAKLGQSFVIENKPGASGNTGTDAVAKADPDGYTIGVSIGGPLAINTLLFSKLPYDPEKDIAPVTQLITQPSALAVPTELGVNTVAELVELIKKNPGKYTFGSIGNGSVSHLSVESIQAKAGVKLVHVPYKSSPDATTALLRNDVQLAILPAASVRPSAEAGKLKILAVTTAKRSSIMPNIPTLKESGIDVEADAWMGLIAPAGTPAAIIDKLNKETIIAINDPAVKAKLAGVIMEPATNSPAEFRARIRAEIGMWKPIIDAQKIKIE